MLFYRRFLLPVYMDSILFLSVVSTLIWGVYAKVRTSNQEESEEIFAAEALCNSAGAGRSVVVVHGGIRGEHFPNENACKTYI